MFDINHQRHKQIEYLPPELMAAAPCEMYRQQVQVMDDPVAHYSERTQDAGYAERCKQFDYKLPRVQCSVQPEDVSQSLAAALLDSIWPHTKPVANLIQGVALQLRQTPGSEFEQLDHFCKIYLCIVAVHVAGEQLSILFASDEIALQDSGSGGTMACAYELVATALATTGHIQFSAIRPTNPAEEQSIDNGKKRPYEDSCDDTVPMPQDLGQVGVEAYEQANGHLFRVELFQKNLTGEWVDNHVTKFCLPYGGYARQGDLYNTRRKTSLSLSAALRKDARMRLPMFSTVSSRSTQLCVQGRRSMSQPRSRMPMKICKCRQKKESNFSTINELFQHVDQRQGIQDSLMSSLQITPSVQMHFVYLTLKDNL